MWGHSVDGKICRKKQTAVLCKKNSGKDYGKLFSCHCSMWHIVVLWQAAKGWKTSIYSMEDDNVLSHPSVHDSRSKKEVRADYEQFLQEVFRENVTSDGITLNYTLKNPTDYGIKNVKPTLGHYTKEAMQNARMLTENELAVLERYDYDKLNEEQQLAYDVLHTVWKQDLSGDNVDEYQEPLSPTTGTQTQLPVILTEYHFGTKRVLIPIFNCCRKFRIILMKLLHLSNKDPKKVYL